jgi:hypothetical protein
MLLSNLPIPLNPTKINLSSKTPSSTQKPKMNSLNFTTPILLFTQKMFDFLQKVLKLIIKINPLSPLIPIKINERDNWLKLN